MEMDQKRKSKKQDSERLSQTRREHGVRSSALGESSIKTAVIEEEKSLEQNADA